MDLKEEVIMNATINKEYVWINAGLAGFYYILEIKPRHTANSTI